MDIVRLYQDYNIPYQTEGHKHCRPGWVNTECPFCTGNPGLHLGYNTQGDFFVCWRCGWKPMPRAIAALVRVSESEARNLIKQYGGHSRRIRKDATVQIRRKAHRLPSGTAPMTDRHRNYLAGRGFQPEKLERMWGLLGTGPMSVLDGINYSHRIIIPIFWQGEQVSFQGRDITNRHPMKYLACPEDRELIKHKHVLYTAREGINNDCCIVVEGVADAWKLGNKAVATFGIKFTTKQLRLLKGFRRVIIAFDDDVQAQEQARKLAAELKFRGVQAQVAEIVGDPGDMDRAAAREFVRSALCIQHAVHNTQYTTDYTKYT